MGKPEALLFLVPFETRNPLQRHNPEQWGTFFSSADFSEFP